MKLSFGIDRILSSPSQISESGINSLPDSTNDSLMKLDGREELNARTAIPIFFGSYPSPFLSPAFASFDEKCLQQKYQIWSQSQETSHFLQRNDYWKADSQLMFEESASQSCGHQRQTDSLSCHVSLQNKHHQQQSATNWSLEGSARTRNEEVRNPYSQVSPPLSTGIRDHGVKRMKEDSQRIINRSVFSKQQRDGLEDAFTKTKYITKHQRVMLAQELNLKDFQVKIWFQNRRSKWRNSDNNRKGAAFGCQRQQQHHLS